MKFDRLQRMKGYRIFRDFSWPTELPNFDRYNLIYGWNGAGKTTLSNLFRCAQLRTSPDGDDIQVIVGGRTINGSDFKTATLPPLRVFNRDFVDRNIFEKPGEEFPPVFFLGEDSAEKQKEIVVLKMEETKVREKIANLEKAKKKAKIELDEYCTTQARAIRNLLLGDPRYNNYEAPKYREQLKLLEILDSLPPELSPDKRSRFESTIGAKPLDRILAPEFGDLKLQSLSARIQKVLDETVIASTIPELAENPPLAAWIQQGLNLHEHGAETCRFCKQHLSESRIKTLEAHFNDQFKSLQASITELLDEVEILEKTITSRQLPAKALLYEHLQSDYEKAVSTFEQQSFILKSYLASLARALVAKRAEPFTRLNAMLFAAGDGRNNADASTLRLVFEAVIGGLSNWGALVGVRALEKIAEIVESHNRHTNNFSTEAAKARGELEKDEVIKSFSSWKIRQAAFDKSNTELDSSSDKLKATSDKIVALDIQIRQHRKPAEELNLEMAAYLGRDELKFDVKDNGYSITRGGHPAMHLSEGEKTAIAFMYFLKSLRDTGFDLPNGVVVIDDPVSSLDANSLYCAFGYMRECTRSAKQVFVLTHNFSFFRQVKNWFNAEGGFMKRPYNPSAVGKGVHFYMLNSEITASGRAAKIETLDALLHAYESEYHYLFRCVREGASRAAPTSLAEVYGMPNVARRLLESFLAFRVPGKAGELRQQVEELIGDSAKKARVVRFLHTHSHAGHIAEPEHDLSLLSETPAVLSEVLELMRLNDASHFEAMLKIV